MPAVQEDMTNADRYLTEDGLDPFQPNVHWFPRCRKHLSALTLAILMAGALTIWWPATPRSAWAFPSNEEMRTVGSAPVGIPVQELINKPLLSLARELLLQQQLEAQVYRNQPVHRGIEINLFAPGDFGVVVRYCW